MNNNILEISGLSFSYSDKSNVINDVSLEIKERENVAIVGSNGAGKTTMFHLISGILKPEKGDIKICGNKVQYGKFNPDLGFVFQSPDDQLFSPTIFDDVAFGLINLGFHKSEIESKVKSELEKYGCLEVMSRPSQHLSGGEKRLVSIATVTVMKPKVILFDEPNSDLDMQTRRKLITLLNSLKITKLISSHDMEFLLETCRKAVFFNNGCIETTGDIKTLFSDKELMEKCGQEVPHSLLI